MTRDNDAESLATFSDGLSFGLTIPSAFDPATLSQLMAHVRHRLGNEHGQPRLLEIDSAMVERQLGAPQMPEAVASAEHEGFETGMLPLEEEILHDELDLARDTLEARRREWRRSVDLARLSDWRRTATPALEHLIVSWVPPPAPVLDEDLRFACDLTAAVGAQILIAPFGDALRRSRLAALAGASALHLALEPRAGMLAEATRCALDERGFQAMVVNADAAADQTGSEVLAHLAALPPSCLPILRLHVPGVRESGPASPQPSIRQRCDLLRSLRDLGRPLVVLFAPRDHGGDEREFSVTAVLELDRARACLRAASG